MSFFHEETCISFFVTSPQMTKGTAVSPMLVRLELEGRLMMQVITYMLIYALLLCSVCLVLFLFAACFAAGSWTFH